MEHGSFDCGGSERRSDNESRRINDDSMNNSKNLRRITPISMSDSAEDKHKMLPIRIIKISVNMSKKTLQHFHYDEKDCAKEVKRRHRLLVRKNNPYKCDNVCDFDRETGASIF